MLAVGMAPCLRCLFPVLPVGKPFAPQVRPDKRDDSCFPRLLDAGEAAVTAWLCITRGDGRAGCTSPPAEPGREPVQQLPLLRPRRLHQLKWRQLRQRAGQQPQAQRGHQGPAQQNLAPLTQHYRQAQQAQQQQQQLL